MKKLFNIILPTDFGIGPKRKEPQFFWNEALINGSPGWARTNDLVINSHPLYR